MHPDIVQQQAGVGALMVPAHIGPPGNTVEDDGDPVQFFMPRMEDVAAQLAAPDASPAPQYWSNAFTRSFATASGPRPSIWCR